MFDSFKNLTHIPKRNKQSGFFVIFLLTVMTSLFVTILVHLFEVRNVQLSYFIFLYPSWT